MTARIVIIDDEEDILELLSVLLQDEGFEVHLRKLTFEDLADVEHLSPDLITLDLFLGHQWEGWELLQRLKEHPPTATIPLILCTAAKLDSEQDSYTQQHHIPVAAKPFDLDDLTQLVHSAIGSRPPPFDVSMQTA